MEFDAILRRRRMHRSFSSESVALADLLTICDAALSAPSAGFTQGTELVVMIEPEKVRTTLELITTPGWLDRSPTHRGLYQSQALIFPIVNRPAYLKRYCEPDKKKTGLSSEEAWPQPYWIVDASFVTMQLLLKVVDMGLGATFMGIYHREQELIARLALPEGLVPLGIICIGHQLPKSPVTGSRTRRVRRPTTSRIHFHQW